MNTCICNRCKKEVEKRFKLNGEQYLTCKKCLDVQYQWRLLHVEKVKQYHLKYETTVRKPRIKLEKDEREKLRDRLA